MPPPNHHHRDRSRREDDENRDGERECAWLNDELRAVDRVLNRSYCPCDADTKEHIHGVAARHVSYGRVGVLITDGGNLAGECVWNRKWID